MAPVDNSPLVNMHGYKLECSLKANDTIPVHKYKSINTGITVFIAEVESPVTCEYLSLATESFDDDGLPHTLEHLIFLGSEEYPYKGLLDLWANRCVASGTNAYTDIKFTEYTMSTASTEGFLSTTQMYLDHILYPTLEESAFITEIYHVNGEGEDGGVVYCEMQGRESSVQYSSYFELCRAIYPGKCGYKSVTGGALKNLRESVNNGKIKKYHKEFYRPENLTIIIAGKIKHTDVFKALQPIEEKIISKGDRGPYNRPWQNPVPPFTKSVTLDLLYASDDEKHGLVTVGWRGPSAVSEIYDLTGCSLLLKYLTDTAVSPLQREFVEIDDPYSSRVVSSVVNNSSSLLYVRFEGVPKAKITVIKDVFLKVLNNINENEHGIDMKRMKTIVHKALLEVLSDLEKNPHDAVSDLIVEDVLYGNTKEDLERRLNPIQDLKKLEGESEEYWLNLFQKYLIDGPVAIVQAIPSIEKKREIAQQEKERLKKRIESLGPQGLEEKERKLQQAIQDNNKPIPNEIWNKVPKSSIDSINFLHIKSYSTDSQEQHPRFNVTKLPLFTYLDHVNTNFIYLFVVMDTKLIPKELRPYVPLLLEVIQESPVHRGGKLIPYEEVVAELEEDTVSTNTRLGFNCAGRFSCGAFSNGAQLVLQLELGKYAKGVQWIHELLYETEFSPERLKIVASKIINDIAEVKRAENKITRNLIKGIIYDKDTNYFASNIVQQQKFLTKMIQRLDNKAEQKEVIAEIESLRKMLTAYNNMMLIVTANVDKLTAQVPDVYEPWNTFFPKMETTSKMKLNIQSDWALINPLKENPIQSCVLGLGYTQSGFLSQYCPCIKDFQNPDLAPLLVCIQYLIQTEGPMWKMLRGQGYSYSYNIFPEINEGLLYFTLLKSTNVVAAYREAKAIVESHISENNWDPLLFESAKSSLTYEIVEKEKTVGDLVFQSWICYFKNVPHDYNQQIVRRISEVTIQDMHRVGSRYLTPLFDSKATKTAIVCHPTKVSEVVNGFKEWNQELKIYNSLEETHLNDW